MFITLEGIDGSGKTTLAKKLVETLRAKGYNCAYLREPGGTPVSEQIRTIALQDDIHLHTEFFLMQAARAELVQTVIKPLLRNETLIVCDRYYLSTMAYQGISGEMHKLMVHLIDAGLFPKPDYTIFLDVPVDVALERIRASRDASDKFEQDAFLQGVRTRYLQCVEQGDRFVKKSIITIDSKYNVDNLLQTMTL